MLHFAASDLDLHCLPMSHKKDGMLIQVSIRTIHTVVSKMHINEAILYSLVHVHISLIYLCTDNTSVKSLL